MSTTPYQLPNSNPENIVAAPVGTKFRRNGNRFTTEIGGVVTEISLSKKAFIVNYPALRTKFSAATDALITFDKENESWVKKTGSGRTGWEYVSDKEISLATTALPNDLFIMSTSNGRYLSATTNSFAVGFYYTGSYNSGSVNTFIVEVSSSSPHWYYSSSAVFTPTSSNLTNEPAFGDTSMSGSPWEFGWTSTVATSSIFGFVGNFKFNGTASVTGDVNFSARLYLKSGFGGSYVEKNSANFTLVKSLA